MKAIRIEIKWALIICLFSFFWIGLTKWLGFHNQFIAHEGWFSLLRIVLTLGLLYLFIKEKNQKSFGNQMTWRDGFTAGIVISLIIICIMPIAQTLGYMILSPHYFDAQTQYVIQNGIMSPDQAKIALNMRTQVMQSCFGGMMVQIIGCGIWSSVFKKK